MGAERRAQSCGFTSCCTAVSEITELPLEGKCLHLPWSTNCFLEMPWYLSVVRTQCSHSQEIHPSVQVDVRWKSTKMLLLVLNSNQNQWTFAHPIPYSQTDNLVKSVRRGRVPRWDVSSTSSWLTGNPRAPFCCGCWWPLPRGPALLCDTQGGQQWVAVICSAWTRAFLPPPTACQL